MRFGLFRGPDLSWSWELRTSTGRVMLRRCGLPSIDEAMGEVDLIRHAPVNVTSGRRPINQQPIEADAHHGEQ